MVWKVTGCSSTSDVHGVDNLYNKQLFRCWQTAGTEKKAMLEIEFDKPTKIKRLEIANAGSAFVEVLVGKKGFEQQQFQVLVPITSFMSIHEVRENTNRNRSRNFVDKLKQNKEVAGKEWERMLVVCTNPFDTKNPQPIGLAYIAINDTSENNENNKDAAENQNHANAKMNNNPYDDEDEEPAPKSKPQQASLDKFLKQGKSNQPVEPKKENNNNNNINDVKPAKKPDAEKPKVDIPKKVQPESKPPPLIAEPPKPASQPKVASQPKTASQPKMPSQHDDDLIDQPAAQPMSQVVFSLSGFQNPLRDQLRSKLLELGASYRPDVGPECTHLIADFDKTPKVNTFRAYKNKFIVKSQWILESHKAGKRLPEAKYSLFQDDSQKRKLSDVDEDDEGNDDMTPVVQVPAKKQKPAPMKHDSDTDEMADVAPPKPAAKPAPPKPAPKPAPKLSNDSDTDEMAEDEIASIKKKTIAGKAETKKPQQAAPIQKPQPKDNLKVQEPYDPNDDSRVKNKLSQFANTKSPQRSPQRSPQNSPPPVKPKAKSGGSDTDDMDMPLPLKTQPQKTQHQAGSDTDEMDIPLSKLVQQNNNKNTKKTSNNNGSDTDEMDVVKLHPPKPKPKQDDSGSDTDEMSKSQFHDFVSKPPPQSQMMIADSPVSSAPQEPDNASLPEFLLGVTAYLHDNLTPHQRKNMNRYIVAYGGAIAQYLYETVTHVISNKWDDELTDTLDEHSCEVVSPDWVMQCHAKQMMVPTKNFVISRITK